MYIIIVGGFCGKFPCGTRAHVSSITSLTVLFIFVDRDTSKPDEPPIPDDTKQDTSGHVPERRSPAVHIREERINISYSSRDGSDTQ